MREKTKRFFYEISKQKLTIKSAAFILGSTYMLSNLLGVIRERLIAAKFGAGPISDIFFASFRIPDLIFQLLVLGAISSAFMPIYIEHLEKKDDSNQVASNFLNFLLISTALFGIIVFLLARKLVPFLLPGIFRHQTDFNTFEVAVNTVRIMILSPIFFSISSVFGGILNSKKRFISYALAPVIYNLAIIFGIYFLAPLTNPPIYGLTTGVILGALLHALIQLPSVFAGGFRWKPILDLRGYELPKIFKLMIPRTLAMGVNQINIIVGNTIIASLFAGGITVLTFANDIQTLPSVVIGISIATAVFPYLAEKYAKNEKREMVRIFSESARKILYFMIPASIGLIILRAQVVRLVFGAGHFDWNDTYWTTKALGFYAAGLVAQGLIPLCLRAFYAIKDTKTPLFIAFVSMIVNLVLTVSLPFIRVLELEVAGIALAFSIAGFVNLGLLLYWLHKKIGALDKDNRIFASTARLVAASLLMGLGSHYSLYLFDNFVDTMTGLGLFLQTIGAITVGAAIYFGITSLWKVEEAGLVFKKSV